MFNYLFGDKLNGGVIIILKKTKKVLFSFEKKSQHHSAKVLADSFWES